MISKHFSITALATLAACTAATAQARDYIFVVGSSTVYPFATIVAEQFGKTTNFKTPKIESTGSGGGLKLFCAGVGVEHPDIANASRRIKASELKACDENGIKEIVEVKIGFDGIVLANAKKSEPLSFELKDIYLALAKEIPDPEGGDKFVPNPYKTWNAINPELPELEIEVLGPPPTSGTRDAFVELAMEGGCKQIASLTELRKSDKKAFQAVCHTMREDGNFIEAGENDNLIVQKLEANPSALGIFGFSFLDQNTDKVQGSLIGGKEPSFDNIAEGEYPVSRALYFYVKKAHVAVIPGIRDYVLEFVSEKATGEDGYLTDKGLIPLTEEEHMRVKSDVENLTPLKLASE